MYTWSGHRRPRNCHVAATNPRLQPQDNGTNQTEPFIPLSITPLGVYRWELQKMYLLLDWESTFRRERERITNSLYIQSEESSYYEY